MALWSNNRGVVFPKFTVLCGHGKEKRYAEKTSQYALVHPCAGGPTDRFVEPSLFHS